MSENGIASSTPKFSLIMNTFVSFNPHVQVFEDSFSPAGLEKGPHFEHNNSFSYQDKEFLNPCDLKTKTDPSMKVLTVQNENNNIADYNVVSACEDKLSKLKALLKCTKAKENNLQPKVNSIIPNSQQLVNSDTNTGKSTSTASISETMTDTESKSQVIEDKITFGNEITIPNNNMDGFDEINGKFYSSSAGSDDSFQIVFSDCPKRRERIPSETESEDSFIVFDHTENDNCFTSSDILEECDSDGESSESEDSESEDSESEAEYDPVCMNVTPHLSKTMEDLTETIQFDEDVVDCAPRVNVSHGSQTPILMQLKTKLTKSGKPQKKVTFSSEPPEEHYMTLWVEEAKQARIGGWDIHALDQERFKRRIANVEMAISWVLKPQHRTCVMFQRFMPWWNAQKRKELEETTHVEEEPQDETGR